MACVVSKTVYNLIKRDKGRLNLTAITLLMMPFVSAKQRTLSVTYVYSLH